MKNAEVIDVLNDIAYLLKCRKDNHFKIRAYQRVAETIGNLAEDVEDMVREDRLKDIPGVGEAINQKITELVTTGRLEYYEKLKAEHAEAENEKPG